MAASSFMVLSRPPIPTITHHTNNIQPSLLPSTSASTSHPLFSSYSPSRPPLKLVSLSGRRLSFSCCAAGSLITEIDESHFSDAVLNSDTPVLVEFIANWCGPCRLITPAIESIAQEYKDRLRVVKIDHDANPTLIEQYKVYGLPTLIIFKDGQQVAESRREGAITKAKLKEYIDSFLDHNTTISRP